MKITYDWLKDHLKISAKEDKLLEKLTDIGLEVESIENLSEGLDLFKVAKILKTEKHPNADSLKVCDVDVGKKKSKKLFVVHKCKRGSSYCICSTRCNNPKKQN